MGLLSCKAKLVVTCIVESLPYELVKQRINKPLWMTSILNLSGACQEAYERGCPSYKFQRAMVK